MSQCRQNYHEECEAGVNKQINMELYASYVYLSMSTHFERDDIALKGATEYFRKNSDEERDHALRLIKFQNQRGGRVVYQDIKKPMNDSWGTLVEAMQAALDLEKNVNQALLDLHGIASRNNDPQMCDFIENHYLTEQCEAIKEIGGHITNLKRNGPGLGEFLYDKELSS